jgi:hypothetical protein
MKQLTLLSMPGAPFIAVSPRWVGSQISPSPKVPA